MREKSIEAELKRAVKGMGGICAKWVSPGIDGVPDRIVLFPGGRIGFVELKARSDRSFPWRKDRICGIEGSWEENAPPAEKEKKAAGVAWFFGILRGWRRTDRGGAKCNTEHMIIRHMRQSLFWTIRHAA